MANSKYAYVRNFELPDPLLPGCFLLYRLDGHSFHRFSEEHAFTKPNDERALQLMDHAARDLMSEFKDIVLAFGESDEFRQAPHLSSKPSNLTPTQPAFSSENAPIYIIAAMQRYYPLSRPISRRVMYFTGPDIFQIRRCAIPPLLMAGSFYIPTSVRSTITLHGDKPIGTVSAQKHEILFQRFKINYNDISARFRKGSVVVREKADESEDSRDTGDLPEPTTTQANEVVRVSPKASKREKMTIEVLHCDIISDEFWAARSHLLGR
ncbi:tRNAHis guanylyltransferase [Lanmaoa asiatica]|nr:tRNAHis guanylyltransferase [Lanmaoa asiatica]